MAKAPFQLPLSSSRRSKPKMPPTLAPFNTTLSFPSFFLFYSPSFLEYLSHQHHPINTHRLASHQHQPIAGHRGPFPHLLSCVRFRFSSLSVRSVRDNAVRCRPTTSRATSYPPSVARLTTANPPPPSCSVRRASSLQGTCWFYLFPLILPSDSRAGPSVQMLARSIA